MLSDTDKARVYDQIADYLKKNGWYVAYVGRWPRELGGGLYETWAHPSDPPGSGHSLISAYRKECYRDAPKQGERMRANLAALDAHIAEKRRR